MPNLISPVIRHASDRPNDFALRTDGRALSYRELADHSLSFAATLHDAGVRTGDRVVLLCPAVPEFVVAYFGIQALGAVAVTVNTMSTVSECSYYVDDSGAAIAVRWHESGSALRDAANAVGVRCLDLGPITETPIASTIVPVERHENDTAAILYTSGTTGRPKGAELTVGNLLAGGEISAELRGATAADRTGTALPLFHVYGQASVMMGTLTTGGSLSLLDRFTVDGMAAMLRRDALTVVIGVPTMFNALLNGVARTGADTFPDLRLAISGGSSLPSDVADAVEDLLGCPVIEGYGLTETTALGTFNSPQHRRLGSVGHAVPRLQVTVRDGDGTPCPVGTVGEVFVAGETIMKGYWKRPDATRAVFVDGWFRTGDLGRFDEDGFLFIVDRLKDTIIRGGYNVYPSEVEEILYAHPDVIEAAVVGVPDEHYGEEVMAVLVVRPGSGLDERAVTAWTRQHLSAYKIPRIVRMADELPKGSTGKILKKAIPRTVG